MKKYIFISAVALFAFSSFLVSCSEDEDPSSSTSKMCTCTETDYDGYYEESQKLDPASFGATNCSDLAVKLRMASDGDFWYDCY